MQRPAMLAFMSSSGGQTRRAFIGAAGALAAAGACGSDDQSADQAAGSAGGPATGPGSGGSPAGPTSGGAAGAPGSGGQGGNVMLDCTPTDPNTAGPYYRADAPFRDDLTEANTQGTPLTVTGSVLDQMCEPIGDALIDVWQADSSGNYDNDGNADPPNGAFILRGQLNADAQGRYSFRTVMPGNYPGRTSHLHVTVSAPGYTPITTQLYFPDDPLNDSDAFILDSLIMTVTDVAGGEKAAAYDFVLAST